ncbi:MAG: DivIVA domain-containing protein [Oscillospiraceae bacterium]|jgi:cell division initiation protein|nr:DivIVA domain-containing protein [Oscillospiraceae bacterium]
MKLVKNFKKVAVGGYKTEDVDEFFETASGALEDLKEENSSLLKEIEILKLKISDYQKDEALINRALVSAQQSAESLVDKAKCEADMILAEAKQKADLTLADNKADLESCKESIETIRGQATQFRRNLLNAYKNHIELIQLIPIGSSDEDISERSERPDCGKRVISLRNKVASQKKPSGQRPSPNSALSSSDIKSACHPKKEGKTTNNNTKIKDRGDGDKKNPPPQKYTIKPLDKFASLEFGDAYKILN